LEAVLEFRVAFRRRVVFNVVNCVCSRVNLAASEASLALISRDLEKQVGIGA